MAKSMSQAVAAFQEAPEFVDLGLSTRKRQMINIRRLLKEIGPSEPVSRLSRDHVNRALNQARRNGVTDASLNAYRTDFRRFCTWLLDNKWVKSNSAEHLQNKKTASVATKRKPIRADQAKLMIEISTAQHPRDGMTALLMLTTGLRESEIVGLRWGHVDFNEKAFRVLRPKIGDWHKVPWSKQLEAAIVDWKVYYESKHGELDNDWFVVPARAHRSDKTGHHRMSPDWPIIPARRQTNIAKRVKRWLRDVGETDLHGKASHTLRRTAGNLLYEKTKNIRSAQTLYGHGHVRMTEVYLDKDVAQDQLRADVADWEI